MRLVDLPREVIRAIALRIYDPLELTQQDRLTWGIFSTVDMHEERQDALASLIAFGMTCKKVRREVRVIQFTCIRTPTIAHLETVVKHKADWAGHVKSIIIDLSMFDESVPRTFWTESAMLTSLIQSMPSLEHISFFADASDDATLGLSFAALIPHPSPHAIPPPTEGENLPFIARIQSFGWRQRAEPPDGTREFSQSSTFVSTLHVLRHAYRLSFLVLDADLDEIFKEDVLIACKELSLRTFPLGEEASKVSLMLCGPIRGWGRTFLKELTDTFSGIKELFIDRPLKKSMVAHETTFDAFVELVEPLAALPSLQLLQVGSYVFPVAVQTSIAFHLARMMSSLLIVGLLGEEGDTNWWGIWRNASKRGVSGEMYEAETDTALAPLGEGHLKRLEEAVLPPSL